MLPLCATAKPPAANSAKSGWTLRRFGSAGGGIAVMADRAVALQPLHHRRLGEIVADQADVALAAELLAVEGDDAGRLLAAVLQRVQPERGQRRRPPGAPKCRRRRTPRAACRRRRCDRQSCMRSTSICPEAGPRSPAPAGSGRPAHSPGSHRRRRCGGLCRRRPARPPATAPRRLIWGRRRSLASVSPRSRCMISASGSSGRRFIRSAPSESSQGFDLRHGDPVGLPVRRDEEVEEQDGDDDEDETARRAEDEAERAVERPGRESSTKSEMRIVMIDTTSSVMKKRPATVTPSARFLSSM